MSSFYTISLNLLFFCGPSGPSGPEAKKNAENRHFLSQKSGPVAKNLWASKPLSGPVICYRNDKLRKNRKKLPF